MTAAYLVEPPRAPISTEEYAKEQAVATEEAKNLRAFIFEARGEYCGQQVVVIATDENEAQGILFAAEEKLSLPVESFDLVQEEVSLVKGLLSTYIWAE